MSKYDNKNFKSYSKKFKYVLTEAETDALKLIGRTLAQEVRKDAPIGATGKLKRNITYSVRRKDKSVQIGIRRKIIYAGWVEFGHKKGKGRSSAPPHPFFMTSIKKKVPVVQEIVKNHLKRIK